METTLALLVISLASMAAQAKDLPFVGTRLFNFDGGYATEQSVTITKNGFETVKYYGMDSTSTSYRGKYRRVIKTDTGDYLSFSSRQAFYTDSEGKIKKDCFTSSTDGTDLCVTDLYKSSR